MNAITAKALDACRAGMSPSEATAFAVMGERIAPAAVTRIEVVVTGDLVRRERGARPLPIVGGAR